MLQNLKAMVVVLSVALTVFAVARPIFVQFMTAEDFERRRNIWLAVTAAAFVSPTFWIFALVALPLLAWAAHREGNPAALYLLVMLMIPPKVVWDIPVVGINKLFELNGFRLLSFAILIPVAWRTLQARGPAGATTVRRDWALLSILAYGALQLLLLMPYESITNTMRRGFLFAIDVLVVYFVFSRACVTRRAIVEVLACYCMVCAIYAPLAVFESAKTWLLYTGIGEAWDSVLRFAFLFRGDTLRAQVSAGESIQFGYVMAIGFAAWLYLQSQIQSRAVAWTGAVWIWAGMIAAFARGPWIVAAFIFFVYLAASPRGLVKVITAFLPAAVAVALVLISPLGARIMDSLPFIGTVDQENVLYRQHLFAAAWELVKQNPFFGSPAVLYHLENLRQGQGIIDLVNAYATVAMFYGLVGLGLFVTPVLLGLRGAYGQMRRDSPGDPSHGLIGAALIASILGTMVMLAVGGLGLVQTKMYYVLAGLAVAYARSSRVDAALPAAVGPMTRLGAGLGARHWAG